MKFTVSGQTRYFPKEIYQELEGPIPPLDFESNGCSCSPDYWRQYDIWPACHIHDWHYAEPVLGAQWASRREADAILRKNLRICLHKQNANQFLTWFLPYMYWGRVRIWGAAHWKNWTDGEKPASFLQRFIEAWGWYKDKRNGNNSQSKRQSKKTM